MHAETIYEILFWIGILGVGVTGAIGAAAHGAHGGHGHAVHGNQGHASSGAHGHAHHGPSNGHAHHGGHSHSSPGTHPVHHHDGPASEQAAAGANAIGIVMGFLSPVTLFSLALGAGATGILLGHRFSETLTAILAAVAGLLLLFLVVRPLMGWVQRWASKPASNLAGTLASEAVAQNRFDEQGRGIVNVSIDGQIVRLLAYLEREDHARGMTIAPGDRLVVTQIDEAKNTCRVTKL